MRAARAPAALIVAPDGPDRRPDTGRPAPVADGLVGDSARAAPAAGLPRRGGAVTVAAVAEAALPLYRSTYRPPDPAALGDPTGWDRWSDFELAVRLIDCSPLEPLLAAHYRPSRKGQVPFHPVSLFLCLCLRREQRLDGAGWRALARRLAREHGAGWRALFGFTDGDTPSASGLRYFGQAVGAARLAALCPAFVGLLRRRGLVPEPSTYPGDPPTRGVTIAQDGMLHQARHRPRCALASFWCEIPKFRHGSPAFVLTTSLARMLSGLFRTRN